MRPPHATARVLGPIGPRGDSIERSLKAGQQWTKWFARSNQDRLRLLDPEAAERQWHDVPIPAVAEPNGRAGHDGPWLKGNAGLSGDD